MRAACIELGGEALELLPEKAFWWPRERALVLADIHLGKAATFRREGVPVPEGVTEGDLARLDALVAAHGPAEMIVLGDLFHAAQGVPGFVGEAFGRWRARHPGLRLTLIPGNHDRRLRHWPEVWGIEHVAPDTRRGGLRLRHFPDEAGEAPPFLAGHLHPAVRLRHPGHPAATLSCFHLRPGGLVLPAFGGFTGTSRIRPASEDRVFGVLSERVIEVTPALRAPTPGAGRTSRR